MKLAFHEATSMTSNLVTDVRASARAGFKALELWAAKVDDYLKDHSLADLNAPFREARVAAASISSIGFIGFRGNEHPQIQARCLALCQIATGIGCSTLVLVPSPTPPPKADTVLELFFPCQKAVEQRDRVLCDLSGIARACGVRLAFEFPGFAWCSVRTLRRSGDYPEDRTPQCGHELRLLPLLRRRWRPARDQHAASLHHLCLAPG